MSQEPVPQSETAPAPETTSTRRATEHGVFLVAYPKIIFLYPTFLAAIAMALYMWAAGNELHTATHMATLAFLVLLAVNLVVLSFDFPRTTSLTLFFFCVALVAGLWVVFQTNPDLVPAVTGWIQTLTPFANSAFYFTLSGLLAIIYVGVFINVRFDYWEVRPNELLHHHGLLSNLERYSAPHLRVDKEINDVFEYILLGSGRLVLHPSGERRSIILDNVLFISKKEKALTRMLGALQVQVRSH